MSSRIDQIFDDLRPRIESGTVTHATGHGSWRHDVGTEKEGYLFVNDQRLDDYEVGRWNIGQWSVFVPSKKQYDADILKEARLAGIGP